MFFRASYREVSLFIVWGSSNTTTRALSLLANQGVKILSDKSLLWYCPTECRRTLTRSKQPFAIAANQLPYIPEKTTCRNIAFLPTSEEVFRHTFLFPASLPLHQSKIHILPNNRQESHVLRWYDIHRNILQGIVNTGHAAIWINSDRRKTWANKINATALPALRGEVKIPVLNNNVSPVIKRYITPLCLEIEKLTLDPATSQKHSFSLQQIKKYARHTILLSTKPNTVPTPKPSQASFSDDTASLTLSSLMNEFEYLKTH